MSNLSGSSKTWQERWQYERWVAQQRVLLLNLLLGETDGQPEDVEPAWRELAAWVNERIEHVLADHSDVEADRARADVLTELVKKMLADRRTLTVEATGVKTAYQQMLGERDRLERALRERQTDLTVESQENLRLRQWLTTPGEELGRAALEKDGVIAGLRNRIEELQAALEASRVGEEAARQTSAERERLIQWLESQRQEDRAWWERRVESERQRVALAQEEMLRLDRRKADMELDVKRERERVGAEAAETQERTARLRLEWEREAKVWRDRLVRGIALIRRLRRGHQEWVKRTGDVRRTVGLESRQRRSGRERLIREILFGAVNQVRNALGVIRGSGQLLAQEVGRKSKALELTKQVVDSTDQLERVLERLIETVDIRIQALGSVEAGEVMRDVMTRLEEGMRNQKIQVRWEGWDGLPPVWGHPTVVQDVFRALIVNALEAMPEGGRLTLAAGVQDAHVALHVVDSGAGFDPAHREELIVPYFSTKPDHAGLGLTFVARAMDLMEGEFEIQLDHPGGTRASVTFRRWED